MSNQAVKAAAGEANAAPKSFPAMLGAYKNQIAMALPKHLNADRMARIALTAFRGTPKLGDCKPESVFAAVIMGSQLGLEPGIMGQAYLIPYGRECQFVPGWQGYVDLVSRAGRASVWTGAVYQGDEFDYGLGDRPFISHKEHPDSDRDPSKLTHCYAVGRVKGAEWPIVEVWSRRRLEKHRDRYNKVGRGHYSFNNFEMYGRKIPLLQVIKYMPKSVEMQQLAELDVAAESGAQNLSIKEAIDGTWTPIVPTDDTTGGNTGNGGGQEGGGNASGNAATTYDEQGAIDALRECESLADLNAKWQDVSRSFGGNVPISVEAARNDRRAALDQKAK
jgi:recombination protein RecT